MSDWLGPSLLSTGIRRSDRGDPALWTWAQWADDVVVFCDTVGIARPVLLGTLGGGWVALTCAIRHPGRLGSLVLDSTMPREVDVGVGPALSQRLGKPLHPTS
jgi:pimeloyl-ACP methyl ester carboxylesterase